jgi:exodeoxyribonuclease VII large subunit
MFEQLDFFSASTFSAPYTVSQLTGRIRDLIDSSAELNDVWLEGEVSNFHRAASGHCYFTLKDGGAQIKCVMWRNTANRQSYLPTDGDFVLSHGRVGVYEARGLYQLYVDRLQRAGVGNLYRQFEILKARLEKEGLFAEERKLPLPGFPRRIGVVTSPKAAALRDILNVLSRRCPLVEVLLSPTLVQGDAAPPQIVAAIAALNALTGPRRVDLIIIARGGGSLEELWAFNDERVARAVAASRLPVICGVGHETDFSLADFAADLRAPTPSAAAELSVPDQQELRAQIRGLTEALTAALQSNIDERRWQLNEQIQALRHLSPSFKLAQARQRLDDLMSRAETALRHTLTRRRGQLEGLGGRLVGISPLGTLERGYAIVRHQETGVAVRSVEQVEANEMLNIRVADGEFEAEVHGRTPPVT